MFYQILILQIIQCKLYWHKLLKNQNYFKIHLKGFKCIYKIIKYFILIIILAFKMKHFRKIKIWQIFLIFYLITMTKIKKNLFRQLKVKNTLFMEHSTILKRIHSIIIIKWTKRSFKCFSYSSKYWDISLFFKFFCKWM